MLIVRALLSVVTEGSHQKYGKPLHIFSWTFKKQFNFRLQWSFLITEEMPGDIQAPRMYVPFTVVEALS